MDEIRVAAVTKPKSTTDQMEELLRRLLVGVTTPVPVPAPVPEVPVVEELLQRLVTETQIRQPAPVAVSEQAGLESLLRSLPSGQIAPPPQPRQASFRRDWNAVVCFSCGKAGHSATRCPTLDEPFPFMLPGWKAEKTSGGCIMISPPGGSGLSSSGKRRLIRGGGGGGSPPGSVVRFDPRTPGEGQHGSPFLGML